MDVVGSISVADFLAWERQQPEKHEFDGIQPIPMTGVKVGHARLVSNLAFALRTRLTSFYEVFTGDLKVVMPGGQVRYPDLVVVPLGSDPEHDIVEPVVVFEVLSPTTELTDRRVKSQEYQTVPSVKSYVILKPGDPEAATIYRKPEWEPTKVGIALTFPEIGVMIPLSLFC